MGYMVNRKDAEDLYNDAIANAGPSASDYVGYNYIYMDEEEIISVAINKFKDESDDHEYFGVHAVFAGEDDGTEWYYTDTTDKDEFIELIMNIAM